MVGGILWAEQEIDEKPVIIIGFAAGSRHYLLRQAEKFQKGRQTNPAGRFEKDA